MQPCGSRPLLSFRERTSDERSGRQARAIILQFGNVERGVAERDQPPVAG